SSDVAFKADALHAIVKGYCREAGVRQLEKAINKVLRKVVLEKVKKKSTKKVEITAANIEKFLGKPIFTAERFYGQEKLNGVATGLAWTEMGGSLLYIEAVKHKGKDGAIQLTGNAGNVMKESAN